MNSTTSTAESAASTSIDNWRTIQQNKDTDDTNNNNQQQQQQRQQHHHNLLSKHPLWSYSQYSDSLALYRRLMEECQDSYVAPLIQDALRCLDDAFRLYGPQSVVCSYNGGKDAVVILHLTRASHANYYYQKYGNQDHDHDHDHDHDFIQRYGVIRPRVIYFDHEHEFPEILSLLHDTVKQYDLDMIAFQQGIKFNEGLSILVENNYFDNNIDHDEATKLSSSPHPTAAVFPMAFVLGTRSTDPNAGNQGQFAPSSSSYMPPFMRVNPVLEWTYGHVWHFLRLFQLPYCSLYDDGYTSLGTTLDTMPCPALLAGISNNDDHHDGHDHENANTYDKAKANGGGDAKYWPAYMLSDWDQERAGRIPKKKKKTSKKSDNHDDKKKKVLLSTPTAAAAAAAAAQQSSAASKSTMDEEQMSTITDLGATSRAPLPITQETAPAELPPPPPPSEQLQQTPLMMNLTKSIKNDDDSDDNTFHSNYSPSECSDSFQRSVGLLIIGDEILKGMCADANIPVAAQALRSQNVQLSKVVIVSDDPHEIVAEIRRLHRDVDVIITSGGVGPTHDDVTIKSVAAALGKEMVFHDRMAQMLREKMNLKHEQNDDDNSVAETDEVPLTDAQIKMATLPSNAKLRYLSPERGDWPTLQCSNIFILPGVPQFFSKKVEHLANYLSSQFERSITYKVVLTADETTIVPALNAVVRRHPYVIFGSYPFVGQPDVKTVVTLEGRMVEGVVSSNENMTATNTPMTVSSRSNSVVNITKGVDTLVSKEMMDRNVKMALDDLIKELPKDSILRVDNDDGVLFS